jgi:hypothetical protein
LKSLILLEKLVVQFSSLLRYIGRIFALGTNLSDEVYGPRRRFGLEVGFFLRDVFSVVEIVDQ